MCRLVLTAGLCLIIAGLVSSVNLTDTPPTTEMELDGITQAATARTESTGSTDSFCEGKANGNYVNPTNPNSFYSCSNGLTHIMPCPAGLVFRQSCDCCDWPTTKPGGTTGGFCEGKPDGNYINPSDETTFYSCSNGLTHIMPCPAGLVFRQSCDCCDWP